MIRNKYEMGKYCSKRMVDDLYDYEGVADVEEETEMNDSHSVCSYLNLG